MCSKRFALTLLGIAAGLLVAAFPAAGKDGVKATLETAIPLDAPAGTRLHIAWKLANPAGRPFSAGGVYVRLVSASGAPAETGVAPSDSQSMGEYAATVAVPEGGIGDVVIGLRGWTSGASGTHRADLSLLDYERPPAWGVVEPGHGHADVDLRPRSRLAVGAQRRCGRTREAQETTS